MPSEPNSPQASFMPETPSPNGRSGIEAVRQRQAEQQMTPLYSLKQREILPSQQKSINASASWIAIIAIAVMFIGIIADSYWIGMAGVLVAIIISLRLIWPVLQNQVNELLPEQRAQLLGFVALFVAVLGLLKFIGVYRRIGNWLKTTTWDEFGSWAEWVGALGQIMIAVLAVYIAWRQYVISRDLTIQQNIITQQQTIDAYFQGISDLALDDEGMLEDWPQERAFAEGRTAAILASVDAAGKAKVLRFLSQSNLLTPLKRDYHLGRPILDGNGGYQEDRENGVCVIDLGVMLAGANLANTDLRWTDLSDAYFIRTNLVDCDLAKANLARTVLYEANLSRADMKGTRLFYGSLETASPRSRSEAPNYITGSHTGAVIERADFTGVRNLSEEQRYYCCAWCGEVARATIPGGCAGVPNLLGR